MTAAVITLPAAGTWGLTYDGDGASSDQRPVAARQDPDDIRQTVETKPRTTEGALAMRSAIDDLGIKAFRRSPGTWATGKLFVKNVGRDITGLRIGSGEEAWKSGFPGPVCDKPGAGKETLVALGYESTG